MHQLGGLSRKDLQTSTGRFRRLCGTRLVEHSKKLLVLTPPNCCSRRLYLPSHSALSLGRSLCACLRKQRILLRLTLWIALHPPRILRSHSTGLILIHPEAL